MERLVTGVPQLKRRTVNHGNFRYYIHDEPQALRIELDGRLGGDNVRSVYYAWRTALSIIGARQVFADITSVSEADTRGKRLLIFWRRKGVQIIAASPESNALFREVLGEAFQAPPPAKDGWLQRLRQAALAGFHQLRANESSQDGNWPCGQAGPKPKNARGATLSETARVECHLP